MTKRSIDTSIEELLVSNGDFEYAHLIKFERPFDKDPGSPNFRTNANRYAYFTDASRDINFNDGSTDQDGNGNGSQVYRANRVLSVGQYSETTSPRAISVGLTLAGEHLGTSISVRGDFSSGAFALDSNNLVNSQIDLVEEGFREGDKVKFTKNSGTFSTGDTSVTYIVTGFSNSNRTFALTTTGNDSDDDTSYPTDTNANVTISLESEELKAALLDRSGVSLANPTFLNRECFIHKVFIDPETGDLIGNTSVLLFKGIISSCSIEESLTGSKVKWSLSSHWADWAAVTGRLTTDEVHRALNAKGQPDSTATIRPEYAYDLGFLHAETTLNQIANYSTFREEITYKTKKRGGLAGLLGGKKLVEVRTMVEENNEVDLQIGLQGKYLPVVYGVQRVAGIPVFADTTENASNIVYVVHALSEGEVHGLYNFYVDGVPIICTDKSDYDVRNSTNGTDKDNSQLQCYGRADQGDTVGGQDTADYATSEAKAEYSDQFLQAKQISVGDDPEARANILRYLLRQTDAHYQTLVNDDAPNLTATDALGLQHQQWAQITDPHNLSLTFFAGRSTQKASSMLITQAEGTGNNGKFKRQADYYDSDLPYWGPDHRLLDTAYVVGAYVISEDQTTVPEVEYTIKGKVFENYNYDNSYLPDSILGSSDDHTNFSEGDDVTVERSTDGSTWSTTNVEGDASDTSFRILHKYLLSTSRGTTHQRFILDQTPDLDESDGVPAYTYLRLKSGSNYWHMRTWNHKAVDGANFALYTFNPSSVAVNGDNKIQLTFSTADANLLKAGYTDEISSSPAKVSYSFKINTVSALTYLADNSIVGTWSGDTITLDAKYDSALNGGTAIGSITDVLTIEMFKNRNFYFGGSGGALTDFTSSAELEGATMTIDQTGESRIIDSFDATNKRVEVDMPFVTLTEANHDSGLTFTIQGTFSDKRAGNNPAMQLLDYLSSNRYGRKLDINEDIDLASFKSSAKLCDVRSDQTIALTTNASTVAVGDIYKLTSDGTSSGTHVASGTVKEVTTTTLGGSTVSKITFEKMSHQFGREYQNYINYAVGEHILTTDGNVYKVTSAGYKGTKPVHTSGTTNGLEYISAGTYTLNKVSGDGPSSVTVNATFGTIYSLYSADFIKYWRYLGWEHHKQCFVTRHQTNFIIGTEKSLFENVNAFLSHFNGLLSYEGGKYVLDVETQVSTPSTITSFNSVTYDWNVNPEYIDSSDIIGSISLTDNSQRTSKNTIKASIQDPQNNFGSRSVSFFNSDYLKADRNVVKTGQWEYSGITNYYNARIGCEKELLQSRYSREISFTVGPKGLLLKAGQVIAVTYEPFGFNSKLFRIENLNFNADCNVQVKAREYDNSIYVISSQRASELRQETATQAAPVKAPAAPTSLAATTNKPGSVILTWTNPTDFVDESDDIEIWASSDNNRANAELIYVSKNEATRFTYTTADAGTNYYWIRTRRRGQKQNGKPKLVRSAYHPSGATNGVTGESKPSSPALLVNKGSIIFKFNSDGNLDPSGATQDAAITVTRQNLTGTPTIAILEADGSSQTTLKFTDASTSITGLSATVDASTATVSLDPKIVRVSLTESGTTYTTEIPIGFIRSGQDGSVGADGKTVKLTPSKHVVSYATDGTETDSISFTTDVSGFTTPYYRFLVDGSEVQAFSTTTGLNASVFESYEPAIGEVVNVKVEVKENNTGSVLATDTVSIYAVQDGSDAVIGFLTNGSHTVQADSSGTVSSFSGATGTYKVFVGGTDVTTSCTFDVSSSTGVTTEINNSTNEHFTGGKGVYAVTAMSADSGIATYSATIPAATAGTASNVTLTADFSISKSIAGADGAPGARGGSVFNFEESTTSGLSAANVTNWVGTLNDTNANAIAALVIAAASDGKIQPNDRITVTDNSENRAGTRVYTGTATATASNADAADFSSLVTETFDGSVIVDGTLSANKLAANTTITNNLKVGSNMELSSGGKFYSTGKTSFTDSTGGFYLDTGGDFVLGDGNASFSFDASEGDLEIIGTGKIEIGSGSGQRAFRVGTDGHVYAKDLTLLDDDGNVYFSSEGFSDYAKSQLLTGTGVPVSTYSFSATSNGTAVAIVTDDAVNVELKALLPTTQLYADTSNVSIAAAKGNIPSNITLTVQISTSSDFSTGVTTVGTQQFTADVSGTIIPDPSDGSGVTSTEYWVSGYGFFGTYSAYVADNTSTGGNGAVNSNGDIVFTASSSYSLSANTTYYLRARVTSTETANSDYNLANSLDVANASRLLSITAASGGFVIASDGTGSGATSNSFSKVAVSGQNTIVSDSGNSDTLTLAAGSNITLTTNSTTDTVTIAAAGGTSANDATITLSAGTALSGGGNFTTNQSSNETITFSVTNNSIGATQLNVTGNGTTAQFLRSDGDGTFTWATPTDTNTTYSAGSGLSLVGTTFSNSAPDQTVTLTGSGATSISGSYPNFTISSTDTNTNTTNFNIQANSGTSTNISAGETINFTGSGATSVSRSGNSFTISSTDTNTDTNNYVSGLSFATGTGVLTATRSGLGNLTVSLDGRYATSSGVTSVATGNGLTGGTITSTGTISMSGSYTGSFSATGNLTAYSSDERLKNILGVIDSPLEKLSKLNGYYFEWNETANKFGEGYEKGEKQVGVKAQEVQEILPEIVKLSAVNEAFNTDEKYLTVQYEKLVPLLIEAIKELKKEVDELKND